MSHRRGGGPKEAPKSLEKEMGPFTETLDNPSGGLKMNRDPSADRANTSTAAPKAPAAPLSLDIRYEEEAKNLKIKQWREGHFATGVMEGTWDEAYAKYKRNPKDECLSCGDDDDGTPCNCCSAMVCSAIGAGRVGNMAILKQSTEWVEEVEVDENGESTARRFTRPKLDFVVGPVRKRTFSVGNNARDSVFF
jgi:hypothetical protein